MLHEFSNFREVNLFLRGMFPLIGFNSTAVYYERSERLAGESHYPLRKMVALAIDGITSLSVKPLRYITGIGLAMAVVSFAIFVYAILTKLFGNTVSGWTSMIAVMTLIGGIQLFCLGIIGEYIGKIYLETKERPRFLIQQVLDKQDE